MRIWHGAALALMGWYLMVPKINKGLPMSQYPLSKWFNAGSFDSDAACLAGRDQEIAREAQEDADEDNWLAAASPEKRRAYYDEMDKKTKWKSGSNEAHPHSGSASLKESICLSSEDPRLAK